jgi:serine/threonine-protein kinase
MESTRPLSAGPPAPAAIHLEGFHVLRGLGEGGMGTVFLAYDPAQRRQVALKLLADHLARERLHVDRFYREARIGASFDHPNIVRTLAFGRDAATGRHVMVLEYVDGPSCHYLLDRDGRLSVDDAVLVIYSMAKALEAIHGQGVVHRDVKPDNILLPSSGVAKLADFGLAKRLGGPDDLTADQAGFGTSWYMSYEQAKNAGFADQRSDIFSLGATFYHLLTGALPFPGDNHAEVIARKQTDRFEPASRLQGDLPPAIDGMLARMLALDPRRRFATARDLIIEIEKSRLLNAYRVGVSADIDVNALDPIPSDGMPTSPDPGVAGRDDGDTWHLRYRDAAGRQFSRRATSQQVVDGLRDGRWPPTTEAARSDRRLYRPLREYPEFRAAAEALPGPAAEPKPPVRPADRRLLLAAGFGIGLLIAATLAGLIRGLLVNRPTPLVEPPAVVSLRTTPL